jgi:SAM-dependent methyltransferase
MKNVYRKYFRKNKSYLVDRAQVKLDHYLIRAKALYDRNNELKNQYPSVDSPEFYRFVDTEAVLYYRELQEVGVPFPPWQEMVTVGGETDLRIFLNVGYDCYRLIRDGIPSDIKYPIKILDFGVGCGRTMRFFFRESDRFECHGCDVDHRAIKYLAKSVPFIQAKINQNKPPLPYGPGSFQLVYSISVFTHLNFEAFQAWLKEMHRVLENDGILQMTLHGNWAFSLVETEPERRKLIGIVEAEFVQQAQIYRQSGFTWLRQPVGSNDIDATQFGISFINKQLLEHLISPYFEILNYKEAAISNWQDFVVLKKRNS